MLMHAQSKNEQSAMLLEEMKFETIEDTNQRHLQSHR